MTNLLSRRELLISALGLGVTKFMGCASRYEQSRSSSSPIPAPGSLQEPQELPYTVQPAPAHGMQEPEMQEPVPPAHPTIPYEHRPQLWNLEDYLDPERDPQTVRRLYLDDIDGPAFIVSWAEWCLPCTEKIPEYNRLYEKYGGEARFISAVTPDYIGDVGRKCLNVLARSNCIWRTDDPSEEKARKERICVEALKKQFSAAESPPSPEFAAVLRDCYDEYGAYWPINASPEDRAYYRQRLDISYLQQKQRWPAFPTHVLDHIPTMQYLDPRRQTRSVLFNVYLLDGKHWATIGGRRWDSRRIERTLKRLIRTAQRRRK